MIYVINVYTYICIFVSTTEFPSDKLRLSLKLKKYYMTQKR